MSNERIIVIESGLCIYSGVDKEAIQATQLITESKKNNNGCLRIKLPVGYADYPTANGNVYPTEELNREFSDRKEDMAAGLVHGCHGEHPEGRCELRPDEISHIVIDAWVDTENTFTTPEGKEVPTIWNEWLIPPTYKSGGKDLITLFESGVAVGCSIRGTAIAKSESTSRNQTMTEYTYMGTDTVGVPSTGFKPGVSNIKLKANIVESSTPLDSRLTCKLDLTSISNTLKVENKNVNKSRIEDMMGLGSKVSVLESSISNHIESSEISAIKAQLEELSKGKSDLDVLRSSVKSLEMKVTSENIANEVITDATGDDVGDCYDKIGVTVVDDGLVDVSDFVSSDDDCSDCVSYDVYGCDDNYATSLDIIDGMKDCLSRTEDALQDSIEYAEELEYELELSDILIDQFADELGYTNDDVDDYVADILASTPSLMQFAESLRDCKSMCEVTEKVAECQSQSARYEPVARSRGSLSSQYRFTTR